MLNADMDSSTKTHKAIIIGAGPAGLAAALQLCRQNHFSCVIYEIRENPTTLGGAVGIPCNGTRLLARLGVYESILSQGAVTNNVRMYSRNGSHLGTNDIASWSENKTGYPYLRVKRKILVEQLLKQVEQEEKIKIRWGYKLQNIEEDENSVHVTFKDGLTDYADILLGCDGIHSAVRSTYIDPATQPEYSGLSSMFSLVTSPRQPGAEQIEGINATLTSDGLFVVTPADTSRNELYWFFTEEVAMPTEGNVRDGWEEKGKKAMESFKSTLVSGVLKDVLGDWGDFLKSLVMSSDAVKFYPLFRLPLGGNWSKGRCILLGDAAHAMQPHAGQGVSMAIEDVFLLSRLLENPSPIAPVMSYSQIFRRLEHLRKPRVEMFYKTAASGGEQRKRMPGWKLTILESVCWYGLIIFNALGLSKYGFSGSQSNLVYDIESVPLWDSE